MAGRYSRARLGLLGYVVPVCTVATVGLLLLCIGTGASLTGFPLRVWIGFLLLAIIPTIFGHTVFNWLLGYVRADTVSVAILAEPVGAAVLAFLIFGEVPSVWTIAGAPLIVGGLVLASIGGSRPQISDAKSGAFCRVSETRTCERPTRGRRRRPSPYSSVRAEGD